MSYGEISGSILLKHACFSDNHIPGNKHHNMGHNFNHVFKKTIITVFYIFLGRHGQVADWAGRQLFRPPLQTIAFRAPSRRSRRRPVVKRPICSSGNDTLGKYCQGAAAIQELGDARSAKTKRNVDVVFSPYS